MKTKDLILNPGNHCPGSSLGLLLLRLLLALLMLPHGWSKLSAFGELAGNFPDPLGLGSTVTLIIAIFAEVACSLLVLVGLGTRVAAIPLVITMLVAAFAVHGADPFAEKELALLYATAFLPLMFTGAGSYSVDARLTPARGYTEPTCSRAL